MYTLTIADYLKCAHSLRGEIFGPAQQMHVSTFDVEIAFTTPDVDRNGIIVDFAAAQQALASALAPLRFQNLDKVAVVAKALELQPPHFRYQANENSRHETQAEKIVTMIQSMGARRGVAGRSGRI